MDGKHATFPLWLLPVAASAQFLPFNDFIFVFHRFVLFPRFTVALPPPIVLSSLGRVPALGIFWGLKRHCIIALLLDGWRRLETGCPEVVRASLFENLVGIFQGI